jgi:hypothetical protein
MNMRENEPPLGWGASIKAMLRSMLQRMGYRIERITAEERHAEHGGYDSTVPLPDGALAELCSDSPRFLELQRRYRLFDSPVCQHTLWQGELDDDVLELPYFRGDNAYVWQYRNVREQARLKYFLYAQYVRSIDRLELLNKLGEDGQFGCFVFRYDGFPALSRDLLDSVNELYFLDRHWNLFGRSTVRVLDIGAGYGRMAHRMLAASSAVERYWCIDAVPRSTFLCEYYLGYRGCLGRATVVPLDDMETAIPRGAVDLAVNIHSFSEMSYAAIAAWLDWLVRLDVRWLLVLPNEPDKIYSYEADGSRRDCTELFQGAGFRLQVQEYTLPDPNLRELIGVLDQFFLFSREASA